MKNRIWVGKNTDELIIACFEKIKINERGFFEDVRPGTYTHCSGNAFGEFGANLERKQVIELEYDSATGEVRKFRETGWYLTRMADDLITTVRFWNSGVWCACPKKEGWIKHQDDTIIVVSEKLPPNEYLKSLE